jgi:hypothetical protein
MVHGTVAGERFHLSSLQRAVVVDDAGAACSCRSLPARLGPDRVSKRRPIGMIWPVTTSPRGRPPNRTASPGPPMSAFPPADVVR